MKRILFLAVVLLGVARAGLLDSPWLPPIKTELAPETLEARYSAKLNLLHRLMFGGECWTHEVRILPYQGFSVFAISYERLGVFAQRGGQTARGFWAQGQHGGITMVLLMEDRVWAICYGRIGPQYRKGK